jgi:hypothetical protein
MGAWLPPSDLSQSDGLGVLYGLGFGACTAVDWALACDVLPDRKSAGFRVGFGIAALAYVLGTVMVARIRGAR